MTLDPAVGIDQGQGAVSEVEQRARVVLSQWAEMRTGDTSLRLLKEATERSLAELLTALSRSRQQQEQLREALRLIRDKPVSAAGYKFTLIDVRDIAREGLNE